MSHKAITKAVSFVKWNSKPFSTLDELMIAMYERCRRKGLKPSSFGVKTDPNPGWNLNPHHQVIVRFKDGRCVYIHFKGDHTAADPKSVNLSSLFSKEELTQIKAALERVANY